MKSTLPLLQETDFPALRRGSLETLQVNLGYLCNQSCVHCHVAAGPQRTEIMDRGTVDQVIAYLWQSRVRTLDLTGGAPELNPNFLRLVGEARELDIHVIDRCNLTVLNESGQEDLDRFLADHEVEIVASLPCYLRENVEAQRGDGVFAGSIEGLRKLNSLGYGLPGTGLLLKLVYNPQGPALPPPQASLEADYRSHLREEHGVEFNQLLTITNMPIRRFGSTLVAQGRFEQYMELLRGAHRPENLASVMCRSLLSVDWQGFLYDCDFNQMLGLPLRTNGSRRTHISELSATDLDRAPIQVADHCYGCTAGQGSSCAGALGG